MQPYIELNLCSSVPCVYKDNEGIRWAPERHQVTVGLKDAYSSVYKDIYSKTWCLGFYYIEHKEKIRAREFSILLKNINERCKKRFDIHENLADIVPQMDKTIQQITKECSNSTGLDFTWSSKAVEIIKPAQMFDHNMEEYFRRLDNKYTQYNIEEL